VPGAVLSLAAGVLLALAGPPATTISGTILDRNGDNRLDNAPGEQRIVRTELASRSSRIGPAPQQLLFFAQMSDVHLVDEESPARVELADRYGGSLNAAYRPQDALTTQVAEMAVRQLRRARSSGGRPLDLVMTTGDGIDNTQLNEVRWFIDVLDGRKTIHPDSGRKGTCGVRHRGAYEGVRGGGHYYEPDTSRRGVDGPGYLPSQSENVRRTRRTVAVRDYPGLLERAERPFRATGLGVPWYAVVGNHDALVQGNVAWNPIFAQGSVGCIKPTRLSAKSLKEIASLARGGITAQERSRIVQLLASDLVFTILAPQRSKGQFVRVESDRGRRLLLPKEAIEQYFTTTGRPVGHGFAADNVSRGQGNYAFSATPRIQFVVLDSAADSGDRGNIDDAQFRWAHEQLLAAEAARQLVLVFAHHGLDSMAQQAPGVHLGRGTCETTDRTALPKQDEPLECLLLRHPSVIALVAGHSHMNRIRPVTGDTHGFWEIMTPADNDWPQQSRLIEVCDNRDGTLSLLATVVDHGGPARPGRWQPGAGRGLLSTDGVAQLASISRELAFNDPQGQTGENGTANRRGPRRDRNVELVVRSPY
jgi:metallophosphoesterase (TIGR03767 family)